MNFKIYSNYEVEEFLEVETFRNWVQAPTKFTNEYWKEFLALHPEQAEKIQQARQLLLSMEVHFETKDNSELDENFAASLRSAMHDRTQQQAKSAKRVQIIKKWAVAATILILIGMGFGIWQSFFNPAFPIQHVADYGEWKTIELPDGSTVHLNANSTLQLADNWDSSNKRQVRLDGEAFFEIAKKPATNANFLVTTENLTIEVLGTQFNVNTKSKNTEIFLEEGKIKLDGGEENTIMQPGDFIAYSKEDKQIIESKKIKKDLPGAWRSGVLAVKEKSIVEIAENLEEIYGVQVIIKKQDLKNQVRTIAIPIDRLDLAIPILEATLQATIEKRNNQLIIR